MPEPSITTPFLTTRSYGIVRSSHPGPMGHARRRRRIVLRCSGRREAGTTVGGLLEVRAGDVVAGAARPGHAAGGVPWVRRGSVRPRAIAVLERGPRAGDTPRVACRGYGAAPSGQEPLRCWSGGRESGTTVGAVPLVGGLPVRDEGQAPEDNLHLESLSHCVSDDLRSRRRGRWRR